MPLTKAQGGSQRTKAQPQISQITQIDVRECRFQEEEASV